MRVLIAIVSCHGYEARREAQRETWIRGVQGAADVLFFVGERAGCICDERDVVNLCCGDGYPDLARKVRSIVRYAIARQYDYLFKCDDDTYVRPDRLITSSGFRKHDYIGFIEDRDLDLATTFPIYPHAQGGPGYWLSAKALAILAEHMLDYRHQEELSGAEPLARNGIIWHHDDRYVHENDPARRQKVLNSGEFITLHKCNPQQMLDVHSHLKSFCPIGAE